uniref:ISAs1 family transposase n=1 Tax=Paractinoplanes polyasparticus TaxID=2856853 RepID=UPI002104D4DD|nr:ISAs1 family transposase [Actinoplanes polyasparticus]
MIRRLLQSLDPDLLTMVIGAWLTGRTLADIPAGRRAIAVDGKAPRGSGTADTAADHVMAACNQSAGVVLASTDVDGKTNEITRFAPLLDQISDLRDTVITADAMHCRHDHVTCLAERGAHWILTVKGNQPHLYKQLTRLPWKAVPDATRDDDRGHGRREIRTCKILTVSTGIDFPHAVRALQIRRRRRRLDEPKRSPPRPSTPSPTCTSTRPNRPSWPHGSADTGPSRTKSTGWCHSASGNKVRESTDGRNTTPQEVTQHAPIVLARRSLASAARPLLKIKMPRYWSAPIMPLKAGPRRAI